jgi:antitoxin (DNA-binding transcriptional repressor) of toxin-antitoxin stability system
MIVTNIHEAKAKLSEFLEAAAAGERVVICKRNRPVAELRAVGQARTEPRPLGGAKGRVSMTSAFFEPLPDEDLSAFEGTEPRVRPSRVAEKAMPYRTERSRPRR